MKEELTCCVTSCERPLDQTYWENQYVSETIGWDLGQPSPPLQTIIDELSDKNLRILIPGCGNAYEAEYLLNQGFTDVTLIDISPTLVSDLQAKFKENKQIKVVLGDFFAHEGEYDLILEQTFFCALPPSMRQQYVWKMHQLLSPSGEIKGLLFNRFFEKQGPPFGGDLATYEQLFKAAFEIKKIDICQNSISSRADTEFSITFAKKNNILVSFYEFQGITCNGCLTTVTQKFSENEGVQQVSMSSDFANVLIVSEKEVPLATLQSQIAYDSKYQIVKV
jgi:SAM-dependent methyltransferase